jgi:hypothetical protein
LLLPFVRLLLQIGDLFANAVEPMVVRGTEYNGANKRCIGVFKRLEMYESLYTCHSERLRTVSSFLPASCPGV